MTEVCRHLFGRVARATVATTVVGVVALAGGSSPVLAADGCPNAGIRAQQGSEALQGCRAYELVSPAQKAGHALDPVATVQGSPDGNAVAYSIFGAVAGSGVEPFQLVLPRSPGAGWLVSRSAGSGAEQRRARGGELDALPDIWA